MTSHHAAPRAFRLGRRPALDGLRALAIVPVVAFHAGAGWATGGCLGVDVFFVLSLDGGTLQVVRIAATLAVTVASFYLVEQPVRGLEQRSSHRRERNQQNAPQRGPARRELGVGAAVG